MPIVLFKIAGYAVMAALGIHGLKKKGVLDADSKKLLDLFK